MFCNDEKGIFSTQILESVSVPGQIIFKVCEVKPVRKGHSKIDKTKILNDKC